MAITVKLPTQLRDTVGGQREEKADEVTETNFDEVIGLNLKTAMFQAQAAARCAS